MPEIEADLHLHTTFSDGTMTPTALINLCVERGLKVISISDHDTTNGLPETFEVAKSHPDLKIIPGIELSTDVPGGEIHVLGYFVDHNDSELQKVLQTFRDSREGRAEGMVKKLNEMDINITWERVKEIAGEASIGRPHIASALVEAGYVEYPKDAFDKYIGREGPAYVERMKLTPEDAIKLLLHHGAVPVMAHPTYSASKSDRDEVGSLTETLAGLKEAGLVGMEVYYGDYTPHQISYLKELSEKFDLIPCGGSDYHASGNPDEPEPGMAGPPLSTVEALEVAKDRM
ncbi:MAG: hypothetical protein BZY79_01845 [SAR202 cluster bacterium Casp-Chloro-G4]|nr:PHP domain-containing protein [Chloroflexota bacterium]MDA1227341.1 PHP domain-containing protein [Chloroflexota bacterium]PKB61815.1 MAG: hypothetical protein BZY79_01845 [SAR202 cluster bacterium Casp-Chloro-G4]